MFRKFALTIHVVTSVGWLGAVATFLALAILGLTSQDSLTVRGAYIALGTMTQWVIVPLALASLLSGLLQAFGTTWGMLRYYWVLIKLLLTVIATAVLLLQVGPIDAVAGAALAAPFQPNDLLEARQSLVLHSAGGLLVLLTVTVLSVYKPRGATGLQQQRPRGQRSS